MARNLSSFLIMASVTLLLQTDPSGAQILSNEELQSQHSKSLVFFQDPNDAARPSKGYGVVVSPAGHVLTVAHVVALFGRADIQASVGSKSGDLKKLTVVAGKERIERREPGLVLLKFDEMEGTYASLASKEVMRPGIALRVLTGAFAGDGTSVVPATVTTRVNSLWQLSGSIDTGNSGSPLFDSYGFIVGFVESGRPGGTIFNAQSAAEGSKLIEGLVPPPKSSANPRFKVYVSTMQSGDHVQLIRDYREFLVQELYRLSERLQVERDFEETHSHNMLLERLFSSFHSGPNDAQRRRQAEKVLTDENRRSELESLLGAGPIYLLLVNLRYLRFEGVSATGQFSAKPVLIELNYDGSNPTVKPWPRLAPYSVDIESPRRLGNVTREMAKLIMKELSKRNDKLFTQDVVFLDCIDDGGAGKGIGASMTRKLHMALKEDWKDPNRTPFHKYEGKLEAPELDSCLDAAEPNSDDRFLFSLARETIDAKIQKHRDGYTRWWRKRMPNQPGPLPDVEPMAPVAPDVLLSQQFVSDWVQDITQSWFR